MDLDVAVSEPWQQRTKWVDIQQQTFTNWVNEQLRPSGEFVRDLKTDFCDGLKLVCLIEVLQRGNKKLKKIKNPINQHQCLENVQVALNAMQADNIKLVNIGNTDVVEGNLKLILGLVWSLIVRYQIGKSNSPARKLMLSWLRGVLPPELEVTNFTTDWNSGILLSALVDYCKPGLIPDWRNLNPNNGYENCRLAMETARDELNIPIVLRPEDLSSEKLDELSGMTYLSYYMNDTSPGYRAMLNWVRQYLPHINNFTTDWNDGTALSELVNKLGGQIEMSSLSRDRHNWDVNCGKALTAAENYLGIQRTISSKEMADSDVQSMAVMSYLAKFTKLQTRHELKEKVHVRGLDLNNVHVNKAAHFEIIAIDPSIDVEREISCELIQLRSGSRVPLRLDLSKHGGTVSFMPTLCTPHELRVYHKGKMIGCCPMYVEVFPDISRILYSGIDPCALGSLVEVLINSNGVNNRGIEIEAVSPTGVAIPCEVHHRNGVFTSTFVPKQVGEWNINVTYTREHIQGSPFTCYVYDPTKIRLRTPVRYEAGRESQIAVDTKEAGWGKLNLQLELNGRRIATSCDERGDGLYIYSFVPNSNGMLSLTLSYNNNQIKGSPFQIQVGNDPTTGPSGFQFRSESSLSRYPESTFSLHTINGRNTPDSTFTLGENVLPRHPSRVVSPTSDIRSELRTPDPLRIERKDFHLGQSTDYRHDDTMKSFTTSSLNNSFSETVNARRPEFRLIGNSNPDRISSPTGHRTVHTTRTTTVTSRVTTPDIIAGHHDSIRPDQVDRTASPLDKTQSYIKTTTITRSATPERTLSPELTDLPSGIFRAEYSEGNKSPIGTLEERRSPYGREKTPDSLNVESSSSPYRIITGSSVSGTRSPSSRVRSPLEERQSPYGVEKTIDTTPKKIPPKTPPRTSSIFDKMDAFFDTPAEMLKKTVSSRTNEEIKTPVDEVDKKPDPNDIRNEFIKLAKSPSGMPKPRDFEDVTLHRELPLNNTSSSPFSRTTITEERTHSPSYSSHTENIRSPVMGTRAATYRTASPSLTTIHTDERIVSPVTHTSISGGNHEQFVTSTVTRRETTVPVESVDLNSIGIISSAHSRQRNNFSSSIPPPPPPPPMTLSSSHEDNRSTALRTSSFQTPSSILKSPSSPHQITPPKATSTPLRSTSTTINHQSKQPQSILKQPKEVPSEKIAHELKILQPERLTLFAVKQPIIIDLSTDTLPFNAELLQVYVKGPSGVEYAGRVDQLVPKMAQVLMEAREVGDHYIRILYAGIDVAKIRGHAFNQHNIIVDKIPDGYVGRPLKFKIDGNNAGSGSLELMVNNGNVGSKVERVKDQLYEASFIPDMAIPHQVDIKFNGVPVPGSPWRCEVAEHSPSQERMSASLIEPEAILVSPCHRVMMQQIQVSPHAKDADLRVIILKNAPGATPLPFEVIRKSPGVRLVQFTIPEAGNYTFDASIKAQKVLGCPLHFKAYDPKKIILANVDKNVPPGTLVNLTVDASEAGEGQLEISVNKGEVANQVQVVSAGKCIISFKAENKGAYVVEIKFNGEMIQGCPLTITAADPIKYSVDLKNLEMICSGEPTCFDIPMPHGKRELLRVGVLDPSHGSLPVSVKSTKDDTVSVEFTSKQVGAYIVSVDYNGHSIQGSPCTIKCFDPKHVIVDGVQAANKGENVQFIVDAGSAGEGNLEITVTCNGQNVQTQVQPMGGAKFAVCFVPQLIAPHNIAINFNKRTVPGSPFTVQILDTDATPVIHPAKPGPVSSAVNTPTALQLKGKVHSQHLYARIINPDGSVVPFTLKDQGNDAFAVEFTPAQVGEYKMDIRYLDKTIPGSPFLCKVYDITQIQVSQVPKLALVGAPTAFLVETAGAGPGNLEVMVNQGRVPTTPQAKTPTLYSIHFTPTEADQHVIDVRFNGFHVPGSPFNCPVLDLTKLKLVGDSIERVPVGKNCRLKLSTGGQLLEGLKALVVGPNNATIPVQLLKEKDEYLVDFTPSEVGDYSIDLRLDSTPLLTAPIAVKVYDHSKVKVLDVSPSTIGRPVFFAIDASEAGAGNLEIIVSVSGRNVPNYVQSEGNAKFKVNFKPSEAMPHQISIKFNGQSVPGSPFSVDIQGNQELHVNTQALKSVSINTPVKFGIDTKGNDMQSCNVNIISPDGREVSGKIARTPQGFDATFTPIQVGPNQVHVFLDGSEVPGSPFLCNVFDVQRIKVTGLGKGYINKPVTFGVDASHAGEGTLELVVSTKRGSVRAEVSMQCRGVYDVTFHPTEATEHYINVTFNDLEIPGNPFRMDVIDEKQLNNTKQTNGRTLQLKGPAVQKGLVGSRNTFDIESDLPVSIRVTKGSSEAQCIVTKVAERTFRAEYQPREVGSYMLEVLQGGSVTLTQNIQVVDPSRVRAMDIEDAIVNRPQSFRIDTTKAGQGALEVMIIANDRKVPFTQEEVAVGLYKISYVPKYGCPHRIDIRYNGHQSPGFPQTIEVRDPTSTIIAHGAGLKSAQVGKACKFFIETAGLSDAKEFDIIVSANGLPLPVRCFVQKDRSLLVEWTPTDIGEHKVEVFYKGDPISGSPFVCQVFDATKVLLKNIKSKIINVNEKISLILNRRDAGYAELDVTAISPLGKNLPIEVKGIEDGESIELTPVVAGKYRIVIIYGGVPVPGSPLTFIAQSDSGCELSAKVYGSGLTQAQKGIMASFRIETNTHDLVPDVIIKGPTDPEFTVEKDEDGAFTVSYLPLDPGTYTIYVRMNGLDIGGPYKVKVVESQKIKPVGGWNSILDEDGTICTEIGKPVKMNFDLSDAGHGSLAAEVELPDGRRAPVKLETSGSKCVLLYNPKVSGEHRLYIVHNGHHIAQSPIAINVRRKKMVSNPSKIVLRGEGIEICRIGEKSEFVIDGSRGGDGEPKVIISHNGTHLPVKVSSMSNNTYRVSYTPNHTGYYELNVFWNDVLVQGCPYRISSAAVCDASRVVCSGEGLQGGIMGKQIKAFIDTRKGGPGELTAHCLGQTKMAHCDLFDHNDGTFSLFVRPQEAGRHMLTVKYGGDHVPGSPFSLRIAGAPDASKVKVYGPGIEAGVLALYQSRFVCDTRGAGAGQLTVRVRGPKGAFRVEMQRENSKDRTILCKYDPTEPGDYRIEVKWSGDHVPGSPFVVMIFDTQEELNRHLQALHMGSAIITNPMISSQLSRTESIWGGSQYELTRHEGGPI